MRRTAAASPMGLCLKTLRAAYIDSTSDSAEIACTDIKRGVLQKCCLCSYVDKYLDTSYILVQYVKVASLHKFTQMQELRDMKYQRAISV